jgi:hypothetical protein
VRGTCGVTGGTLATITLPDGRKFGDTEFGGGRGGGGPGDSQADSAQLPPGTEGAK